MAVRKSRDKQLVLDGPRSGWLARCAQAMAAAGFKDVQANAALHQVTGTYKRMTVWGRLEVALAPAGDDATEVRMHVTANVDNIYALFSSPTARILAQFEQHLGT